MTRGRKLSMRLQIGKEINDQRKSPATKQNDGRQTQIREENCNCILTIFYTRNDRPKRREHVLEMALSMRRILYTKDAHSI